MESSRTTQPTQPAQPAPRRAAAPRAEGERPDEKELKAQTDDEIAERLSTPPETPTPTQAEADALKAGEAPAADAAARQERDVKPDPARPGYTTR